jgi:hypothetical protein
MRSDDEDPDMNEQELYELLDEVLNEPVPTAPPGVEERYQEMIRAHFARRTAQVPGWRSVALLVACVSVVLVVLMSPAFSLLFALMTVTCAGGYVAFLRAAAGWTEEARPA